MTFEVVDLHRSYGSRAILRGVNFILNQGELVCLMGENGAGKTTFIDTVLSRVAPVRGEIRFHDQVLTT
ncbi:MAG TPA: ATP-binding cassette domain-containing protein, partial [Leptospiraceae bacterium]|nr:ATP-binding cassette domain-containing protein [Leptospiraceae bacterium]